MTRTLSRLLNHLHWYPRLFWKHPGKYQVVMVRVQHSCLDLDLDPPPIQKWSNMSAFLVYSLLEFERHSNISLVKNPLPLSWFQDPHIFHSVKLTSLPLQIQPSPRKIFAASLNPYFLKGASSSLSRRGTAYFCLIASSTMSSPALWVPFQCKISLGSFKHLHGRNRRERFIHGRNQAAKLPDLSICPWFGILVQETLLFTVVRSVQTCIFPAKALTHMKTTGLLYIHSCK